MKAILAILLLLVAAAHAEPAYQFLVLVDGSQSMNSRQDTAVRKVRDLVRSGFQNQAMEGDVFDLWTFTTELKTNRFATQVWTGTNQFHAEAAAEFLEREKFIGRTRFANIAEELNAWIARQSNALIFIFTDGEDAVRGVPNDLEINSYIAPRKGPARTAKRLFLISYSVKEGRVAEWMAHDGLGRFLLPRLPGREPLKPALATAASLEKNPAGESPAQPVFEPPPPPAIDLPPGAKVVAAEPPATTTPEPPMAQTESKTEIEMPKAAEPPARQEESKPAELESISAPVVGAAPILKSEPKIESSTVETKAQPAASIPGPIQEVSRVKAETTKTNETVAAESPLAVAAPRTGVYFMLGAGVMVLLIAVVLLRRSPGEKASLISKSLSQK